MAYELGEVEDAFPDSLVVGVDEVGLGTLAGPVTAGAVALDLLLPVAGFNDSKKLSATRREKMRRRILDGCIACSVQSVNSREIDRLGIAVAANVARRKAVVGVLEQLDLLHGNVELVIAVDGENEVTGHPRLRGVKQRVYVKGDQRSWNIAAASIIAKQSRDEWMVKVAHRRWPQYGFSSSKGYGTKRHMQALLQHGACEIHRRSFRPIRELEGR